MVSRQAKLFDLWLVLMSEAKTDSSRLPHSPFRFLSLFTVLENAPLRSKSILKRDQCYMERVTVVFF